MVQRAVLFVNLHKTGSDSAAEEICGELEKRGVQVTLFAFDGRPESLPQGKWDIAFTLGGDGTVLYAARILAEAGTPVLPLHFGTLGFLAGVEQHEWLTVYQQWVDGTARISSRCMLDVTIKRDGLNVMCSTCLNDAVISASGIAKLIRLNVKTEIAGPMNARRSRVDEQSQHGLAPDKAAVSQNCGLALASPAGAGEYADLGCYRSDGLIIATPTGSTAYSMAAGGPILDPEMEAVILSPVCPFTLSNRPMVLPSRQTLLVTVEKEQRSGVLLTIDGQDTFDLQPEDNIIIRHSPCYVRLITVGHAAYYSALRGKLSWGGGTDA